MPYYDGATSKHENIPIGRVALAKAADIYVMNRHSQPTQEKTTLEERISINWLEHSLLAPLSSFKGS
jgi:hypothetical protein